MSACKGPKVLLLDEYNRATTEVLQTAMQITLDRELNGWKLHPETRIYAAINASAEYIVNELDPAQADRFWTVDLEATVEDWLTWASELVNGKTRIDSVIIDFIRQNPGHLRHFCSNRTRKGLSFPTFLGTPGSDLEVGRDGSF